MSEQTTHREDQEITPEDLDLLANGSFLQPDPRRINKEPKVLVPSPRDDSDDLL